MKMLFFLTALLVPLFMSASGDVAGDSTVQELFMVKANRQKSFRKSIPPGDYSGITSIGGNKYAVVIKLMQSEKHLLLISLKEDGKFMSSRLMSYENELSPISSNPSGSIILRSGMQ